MIMEYGSRRASEAALDKLIACFTRLPGMGPRSARRAVLHLLLDKDRRLQPMLHALTDAHTRIIKCGRCGNLDLTSPCSICADARRGVGVLCVVESVSDLWAAERSGAFNGRYHVLGGVLSALNGVSPAQLNLHGLSDRVREENITEAVIALSVTPEAQTTAYYVADLLRSARANVQISVPARGMPMGSTPEYTDEGTLTAAFAARVPMP